MASGMEPESRSWHRLCLRRILSNMSEKRIIRRRIVNAYLSAVLSISLVLLLVGVAAMLLVNTESVARYFKENLAVTVMMKSEVTEPEASVYCSDLEKLGFVRGTELVTRERGEQEMAAMLGEDFLSVFGTSPIPLSVNVRLAADYVTTDSVKVVENTLMKSPLVEEVVYQQSLVESLNSNLAKISMVLGVMILLLMLISFALISNTVRLSVFDRRFNIYTMKLVGATRSFIRAPFMLRSVFLGLFSAFIAILMLLGILFFVRAEFAQLFELFSIDLLLIVMGIVIAAGVIICVVSTYFVVNKLVSLSKDELYF